MKHAEDVLKEQENSLLMKQWQIEEAEERATAEYDKVHQQMAYSEMLNDNR